MVSRPRHFPSAVLQTPAEGTPADHLGDSGTLGCGAVCLSSTNSPASKAVLAQVDQELLFPNWVFLESSLAHNNIMIAKRQPFEMPFTTASPAG